MLKFLGWKGRFPRGLFELPDDAIEHVARQVKVAAAQIGAYDFTAVRSRTIAARSAPTPGFGSAASAMPSSSPLGWRRTSARTNGASNT